jgi:hypothetical protein
MALMAGALTAALAMSTAGTAYAAFPGTNGPIAFNSDRDVGAGEIYAITPGGLATRLTSSNSSSDPAYSPDGSRIAFIAGGTPGGTYQVFVMSADGQNVRQVTTSATAKQDPTWAPDGNTIAYSANSFDVDGQTDLEIWAVNADGSGTRQITSNTFPDTYPAWSPDGSTIAFVGTRPGDTNRNIYVMGADGSGQTNITPNTATFSAHDDDPAWSPDGTRIAFVHTNEGLGGGPPAIWTMGPDGSSKTNLTNNPNVSYTSPAWSPQGDKLAAVGTASGTTNRDIWAMNADGSGQAPVEQNPAHDINPDWGTPWTAPPLTPEFRRSLVAGLVSGTVLIREPGESEFHELTGSELIPLGSSVETTNGRVGITAATKQGGTQRTEFYKGQFNTDQAGDGLVTAKLEDAKFGSCKGGSKSARRAPKKLARLWGNGKGKARTKGRRGSGTVRGTVWLTEERCDGTFFKVKKGKLQVRDFKRKKNVTLKRGESYLAKG